MKVKVKSLSRVPLFATPWTVAYQAPLSMGFSRQEYWSWVAVSSNRGSSQPRDWTGISCVPCISRWVLYHQCHLRSQIQEVPAMKPGDASYRGHTANRNSELKNWKMGTSGFRGKGRQKRGTLEGQVGPRSGRAYRARETNSDVTWGRMGIYLDYSLSSGLTIRLAFSTVTLVDGLNGLEVA